MADNSQNKVEMLKKEIEGLREEFSRVTQINEQYRNEMLSRLTERLESHATQLEQEIKGRFYGRLKLIVWGATALFLLGTAFGLWNVTSTIPQLVSRQVENRVAEETEGISSLITEKLKPKLERDVQTAMKVSLTPLETKLRELTKIADTIEPVLLPVRLWDASSVGDADHVDRLLKKGVDKNARDFRGRTAIILAAMGGHADVAEILLSYNASVDVQDNDEKTALMYASAEGYLDVIKKLLRASADLELRGPDGATPLIAAVNNNQRLVVYTLLQNGTDVNARSNNGQTPLIWATYNGNTEIVKLLLDFDADVEITDQVGEKALNVAERLGREDIQQLLEKVSEGS